MRMNAVRWALDRGDFPKAISHMQGLTKDEKYQVINAYCNDNRLKGKDGDYQAASNYAYCVEKGLGDVEADVKRAERFYRYAAKRGNLDALMNLIRLKRPLPRYMSINEKKHMLDVIYRDSLPYLAIYSLGEEGEQRIREEHAISLTSDTSAIQGFEEANKD